MTAPEAPQTAPGAAQAAPGATRTAPPSLTVRARDLLACEWTKLRCVRSNYWTLLIAAVATLGSTAVAAQAFAASPLPPPGTALNALTESFLGYGEYAMIPVGVLSILVFSSEYASGLIATTFTAAPRRWTVLAAKAAVTGLVALLAGELLAFAAFLLTQAVLAGHHRGLSDQRSLSLSQHGVTGSVLAAGLLLPVCALLGLGLGAIVRHTAGAIAALIGLVYLLAALCLFLPAPWNDRVGRFTVAFAAFQVVTRQPLAGLLSPATALLVLIAWPVAMLALAAVVLTRRDA